MSEVSDSIERCYELVKSLSATCCESGKSERMNKLVFSLQKASTLSPSNTNEMIEIIRTCGGIIGELHVLCCVNAKEKLYREILTELNKTYINASKI